MGCDIGGVDMRPTLVREGETGGEDLHWVYTRHKRLDEDLLGPRLRDGYT